MGWRTRTRALPIGDLRQIAYLLPMWDGIASGVVLLWRRLICLRNSSFRMFWYRDWSSSYFFPRFGLLEHEANRTPDISATFIGSRKKFCKRKRMSVCLTIKRKPSILSVSYRLNGLNRCSRGRTTPLQILWQNMVRAWYSTTFKKKNIEKKDVTPFSVASKTPWPDHGLREKRPQPADWPYCTTSRPNRTRTFSAYQNPSATRGCCIERRPETCSDPAPSPRA